MPRSERLYRIQQQIDAIDRASCRNLANHAIYRCFIRLLEIADCLMD